MNNRLLKVQSLLSQYKIDALLVVNDIDVRYLTQYPMAAESWLLITSKKNYYLTDFRYFLEVKKALKGIKTVQYQNSIFNSLFEIVNQEKIKHIGINENHWSVARYHQFQKVCPKSIKLVVSNTLVESLREIKEPGEIEMIRKGLVIHHQALKYIKKYIKPNITEKEICTELEGYIRSRNAGLAFSPIIASGPNSSFPHAHVTTRKIRNNEPVLVDMGVDLNGYKTDLTRMFFLGKISNLIKEITAHVYEAQQRAIATISDGINIAEVDLKARKYLESRKLAKYFGHSLGHGVGLEIHESPRLYHTINRPLKSGMVVTVEPAVYLPNRFGIRLEEMVLVKKKGCEVISGTIN